MTHALQSYSEGRWQDGLGEQRPLLDAATGEVVATIPARGPDVAAMLGHARTVGGPALRALTFPQRAAILKGLARHLSGCLEELAGLSTRTGATRRDTVLHGGPGRAGGGEELGGLRAVRHHLERTAVQGHPDLLARLVPGGTQDPEEER